MVSLCAWCDTSDNPERKCLAGGVEEDCWLGHEGLPDDCAFSGGPTGGPV